MSDPWEAEPCIDCGFAVADFDPWEDIVLCDGCADEREQLLNEGAIG